MSNTLDSKWKVNNYRPFGIIARDPDESTYAMGDDKFSVIVNVEGTIEQQRALAFRVVEDHNNALALRNDRDALLTAAKKVMQSWDVGKREAECVKMKYREHLGEQELRAAINGR